MLNKLKKILEEKDIRLIIFGETHGFLEDNKFQEEIINLFKPKLFLYELLEETSLETEEQINNFLMKPDSEDFSIISTFGELKSTIEIVKKHNLPIKGIDIKNMLRKDKTFLTKLELTEEEIKLEEKILKEREEKQKQQILLNLQKENKVIVSTGAYHLREGSLLLNLNLNYLVVYPAYNGEQVFEPPADFERESVSFEVREIVPHA
jgi:hypothetical protein